MSSDINQINKEIVWDLWQKLDTSPVDQAIILSSVASEDIVWYGPDPLIQLTGSQAIADNFWTPLQKSFPDLTRQTHIFFGGYSNGRIDGDLSLDGNWWVTGTGLLSGTFDKEYLGIPATGSKVEIRWGEFYRFDSGKIVKIYFLIDLIDLMQQAGFNVLPQSLGVDGDYPSPAANDGIIKSADKSDSSLYTLEHIRSFIFEGLNKYDESNLESMGVADFFHPKVNWYGPGGIGACYNLKEFEEYHQIPWLKAYPDREVQDLDSLFAEGQYSGGSGWAGVLATHTGEYKGVLPTGNKIKFNGLDWWKRDGDRIIENWVFVDMIHLFKQFGINLFERMKKDSLSLKKS